MDIEERIILQRLREDDYYAFEHLFRMYQPKLFLFAKRYLKDEVKAHEAVNDVFIKFWEKRNKINLQKSIEAYLVTSTKNQCINYFRTKKTEPSFLSDEDIKISELELNYYQNENILDQMISMDLTKMINSAISKLPDQQRKIFDLSRAEGLSSKEIALKLKLSARTVETHIYLAIKFIKDQLKNIL